MKEKNASHMLHFSCEIPVESISKRGKPHLQLYLVIFLIFLDHSLPVYSSRIIGFRPKNKSFVRLSEGSDRWLESFGDCHDLQAHMGTWH